MTTTNTRRFHLILYAGTIAMCLFGLYVVVTQVPSSAIQVGGSGTVTDDSLCNQFLFRDKAAGVCWMQPRFGRGTLLVPCEAVDSCEASGVRASDKSLNGEVAK